MLSKMDYADAVFRPIPLRLLKRLQKVQNAAASFVFGRYAKEKDVITLGWLPMKVSITVRETALLVTRLHISTMFQFPFIVFVFCSYSVS